MRLDYPVDGGRGALGASSFHPGRARRVDGAADGITHIQQCRVSKLPVEELFAITCA